MKTIMVATFALLLASFTAGGCVMDDGEEILDEEETSEVEQGLGSWPYGKTPVRACTDNCNTLYKQCTLTNGETDRCYDAWQGCRANCTLIWGPVSAI